MDQKIKACNKKVGSKPWWMGDYQYDPCYCILEPGHAGECACDHMLDDQNRIVEEDEFPDDIPLG